MTTLLDPALSACPRCGTPYRDHARFGFCSRCVATVSFADAETPPPEEDELAAVLPRSAVATTAPTRFGDYEFLDEIARGGMGVIYRARQRSLQRIVAVKMLLFGGWADPDRLRRFRNEAAAAAALEHPHIVRILDVGEHEGQPFIAMEYVSGTDLGQLSRPLGARQAAGYVEKITRAIDFAHQHGVLHRDLKPSNVILDALDEPRVTDFGLARNLAHDSDATLTGQALGSPNFMPPEQARGDLGHIGPSSDVYGLGAILYHLLTARPPFLGETVEATLAVVCDHEPVSPRQLNAEIPRDLETICLKCLEKEPAKRYPTAQALADDLERFLNDEPILARPVTRLERAVRWCRRKPALATAYGLLLFLVLLLSIASPIAAYRIDQARQEAVQQARQARLNQYVADVNLAYRSIEVRDIGRARHLLETHADPRGLEDFRGWEWHYLWARTGSEAEFKLGEHPDSIRCAAYSPSGSLLASGDLAGHVKVWDLELRTLILSHREERTVHSLAFLSEMILATANQAGSVSFYDVAARKLIEIIETGASVRAIAVAPDGRKLAWLLGPDGGERLSLWDLAEPASDTSLPGMTQIAELPGPDWHQTYIPMNALAFSPNGKDLAAGYSDGRIRFYDSATGVLRQTIEASDQVIATLAYSADGRWLASGAVGTDTAARVWDAESGELVASLSGHSRWVSRVAFLADDTRLLTTSPDQTVRLWDTATWQLDRLLQGHTAPVLALAVDPSGERFITGGKDQSLLAWTLAGAERTWEALSIPQLRNFAFSPIDGSLVSIESRHSDLGGSRLTLRRAPDYDIARELVELGDGLIDVCFAPRTVHFVAQAPTSLQLWDSTDWRLLKSVSMPDAGSWELLGLTDDANEVLLVDRKFSVKSWNLTANTFTEAWSALGPLDPPTYFHTKYAAIHPPSGTLVLGGDGAAAVWDVRTRSLRGILEGHQAAPVSPVVSPNGQFIVTAGDDGNAFLWDAKSLTKLRSFQTPRGSLQSVAFSPDGRRIATGFAPDLAVGIYDVETGRELMLLNPGVQMASRIRWSPDGQTLVAHGVQGAIWRLLDARSSGPDQMTHR